MSNEVVKYTSDRVLRIVRHLYKYHPKWRESDSSGSVLHYYEVRHAAGLGFGPDTLACVQAALKTCPVPLGADPELNMEVFDV